MPDAAPAAPQSSRLAFAVLAVHAALSPLVLWTLSDDAFEPPKIAWLQTAALALAGIYAARFLAAAARGEAPLPGAPRDAVGWGVLAVLGSCLASTLASASPATSLFGAARSHLGLLSASALGVLFVATRHCATDPRRVRGLLAAWLVGATGACAYAGVQLAGLDPLPWQPTWALAERPFGTLGQPNFLGSFLAVIAPLAAYAALSAARAGRRAVALGLAVSTALFAALCVLCLSRGAWLALAAALVVLIAGWWRVGERRAAAVLGALTLAATAVAALALFVADSGVAAKLLGEGVGWRLTSFSALAGETRLHLWQAAWRMFLDHPLLGAGLDCFVVEFDRYRTPAYWLAEWNAGPTRAHASLLQIASTQGGVGLAAWALLAAALVAAAARALRSESRERRLFAVALCAGLAAFVVQGLFSFTFSALGALAVTQAAWLAPAPPAPARAQAASPLGAGARALQALAWSLVGLAWLGLVGAQLRAEALRAEGAQLTLAGAPELAAERLARAITWDGAREDQWVELGLAHYAAAQRSADSRLRRERLAAARQAQERAFEMAPHRAYASSNLARTLLAQAALAPPAASADEVRAAYDRALALDAANAYILRDAAHAAYALGELARAQRIASRSVELYPRYAPGQLYLGLSALRAGDTDAAVRALDAARGGDWVVDRAQGPTLARTALAAARLARRELDDAARLAQESIAENPADALAWTYLGTSHELRAAELSAQARELARGGARDALEAEAGSRRAQALAAYQRAAALAPEDPVARGGVERLARGSGG